MIPALQREKLERNEMMDSGVAAELGVMQGSHKEITRLAKLNFLIKRTSAYIMVVT